MWLNVRTEYSFGKVYGRVDDIVKKLATMADYAGIADLGNTFGHAPWATACKKYGIKPIFGVQLPVVKDLNLKERRYPYNYITFIAKNNEGLEELYKLVDIAHQQFYYRERLSYEQVNQTSENLFIFGGVAPQVNLIKRPFFYEIGPHTPESEKGKTGKPTVCVIDNYYINPEDKKIYEPFSPNRQREKKTSLMYIPTREEWHVSVWGKPQTLYRKEFPVGRELQSIASVCNAVLPTAPMVKWEGKEYSNSFKSLIEQGVKKRKLPPEKKYENRLRREIEIIKEKNFQDYFLIVADLVKFAKTKMAVGPARGSAAGSLVCYLLGITEVDPIKYDLYFERFIDLNRDDLPDIDIDFQDHKMALKYLEKKYGKENVAQIANISRLKPRSALTLVSKALSVPLEDIEEIKNTASDIQTAFKTDMGKKFLEKYPQMSVAADMEGHASHSSVHAAGILVCNKPITSYCGINSRGGEHIAMIDKRDAEKLNLLKIDALGLRTLSIIAEVCDAIGKPYKWIYSLPVDDKATFEIFNQHRFEGVFQFEGDAVKSLAKKMPIENIEDIAALSALGRPGPLGSGAAWDYVNARAGRESIKWINKHPLIVEATKKTYGVIVYQEQVMQIVRGVGKLSWSTVGDIRKAISKSDKDKLNMFKDHFIKSTMCGWDLDEQEIVKIWEAIQTFGGYAFNKSHAVSYALISYYCAYLKTHYPLEFTVACLNNTKDDNSAIRVLRDAVENEGVEYQHINLDESVQKWSCGYKEVIGDIDIVDQPVLLGGFLSIHGIGPAAANKIVKYREEGKTLPPGIKKHLANDISPFKYLYPAHQIYGKYYTNPEMFGLQQPAIEIAHVKEKEKGSFNIIGKLVEKKKRDLNEDQFVQKRGGQYLETQTSYLLFILEDDTDSIRCKIKAEDYSRLGKEIVENGQENTDWYLVNGQKINNWNILFVYNIRRITR